MLEFSKLFRAMITVKVKVFQIVLEVTQCKDYIFFYPFSLILFLPIIS